MIAKAPRSSDTVRNVTKSEVHARLAQKFGKFSFKRKLDIDIVVCLRPSQISVIVLSLRMITRLLLHVSELVTTPFSRTPLITVLSTEGLSWVNIPFILLFIIHPNPGLFYILLDCLFPNTC